MGIIKYTIQVGGLNQGEIPICTVTLHDAEEKLAIKEPDNTHLSGILKVPKAKLWWPRGMNPSPGYLYTLEVYTYIHKYKQESIYSINILQIKWTIISFLLPFVHFPGQIIDTK